MKIGLLGGSFNPIHYGHLLLAEAAKERLSLKKVIFIPVNLSPHQKEKKVLSETHRYRMVRLAVKENPSFSVSDIEIRRKGPSYTIDTVRALQKKMPGAEFFLLVGSDCLKKFHTWKESRTLRRLCHVVVAKRPGHPLKNIPRGFRKLEMPEVAIASNEIRQRIHKGRSVATQIPRAVERYIRKNCLYR